MQSIFGEREPELHGHTILSPTTKRILSTYLDTGKYINITSHK